MVSIFDIEPRKLIDEMAKELGKMPEMAPPEWASFVKTGVHKERPPVEEDWWYVRSAAVLRAVYKLGPIGVSKLRTKYGGRKNRGFKPDQTRKASGNILRKILQKLEIIGFIKQAQAGVHKGRELTNKGKSFVDKIAAKELKGKYKKVEKPSKESKEVKKPEAVKEEVKAQVPNASEEKPKKAPKAPKKAKEVAENEQV